jgi:hypothetical protein
MEVQIERTKIYHLSLSEREVNDLMKVLNDFYSLQPIPESTINLLSILKNLS